MGFDVLSTRAVAFCFPVHIVFPFIIKCFDSLFEYVISGKTRFHRSVSFMT